MVTNKPSTSSTKDKKTRNRHSLIMQCDQTKETYGYPNNTMINKVNLLLSLNLTLVDILHCMAFDA